MEDDEYYRNHLVTLVQRERCEAVSCSSVAPALHSLREHTFGAAIVDWHLADGTGVDVLREVSIRCPNMPVIMISAYVNIREIASSFRLGALDFLKKPVNEEQLVALIRKALGSPAEDPELVEGSGVPPVEGFSLIGESPAIKRVRRDLNLYGKTDAIVLIEGETGTGKEIAARILHVMRCGAAPPFEALDCGAIPEGLAESELFGHVKGAFTDAHAHHRGLFDRAGCGTAFLDEVGELRRSLQPKLLRVLELREYRSVGGEETKRFEGKIVLATNRNLRDEVRRGHFRQDLYARISEAVVTMPSLRVRGPDEIEMLANHFLRIKDPVGTKRLSDMALSILRDCQFANGNVRELRRFIFRAFYRSEESVIGPNELPLDELVELNSPDRSTASGWFDFESLITLPFKDAKRSLLGEFERRYIERHYRQAGYHIGRAAREIDLSEKQLGEKLKEYNIRKPPSR